MNTDGRHMEVRQRRLQPEWMDDPRLDQVLHVGALNGLRRINAWSRTASYLWRAISHIASERKLRQIRLLDVACGGGDLALQLACRAARAGVILEIHGCDISPTAIRHASTVADQQGFANCQFFIANVFEDPFPVGFDVIVSTLFLHHLEQHQAIRLLTKMADATKHAIFIDDLLRSRRGYWLAQLGCRLLSRSPVVHYDGPVSVLGAYTLVEVQTLGAKAGLVDARFQKHWPERYLMSWTKAA